jgi:tetratricopeptide (TPR) repeat protein
VPPTERLARLDGLRRALQSANATDVASDFLDGVVLAPAMGAATSQFREQPDVEAALKQSLGVTYYRLGLYGRAGAPVADALRIRTEKKGAQAPETLESRLWSARVAAAAAANEKERAGVETPFKEGIDAMRGSLGESAPLTLFAMRCYAEWLDEQGRRDDAIGVYEQALGKARGALDPLSDTVVMLTSGLAYACIGAGRPERAVELLEPLREAMRRTDKANPRLQLIVLRNLAMARARLADLRPSPESVQAADVTFREALDLAARTLGDEHPHTFRTRNNLAAFLRRAGRAGDARPLLEQSVAIGRSKPGTGGLEYLYALNDLGQAKLAAGDAAGAEPLIAEAELGLRSARGMDVLQTQEIVLSHARLLLARKRFDDAIARMREVLARQTAGGGPSEISTIDTARELGRALAIAGRFADADAEFGRAEGAIDATRRPPTSDARWNLVNQWMHALKAWSKAEPKGPAAGRMPAVQTKLDQLRQARQAANPPLPIDWKDE